MNWEQVEGKWDQFKGSVKEKWGKLTDDDLTMIEGRRENLTGRLKERYGLEKEAAEKRDRCLDARAPLTRSPYGFSPAGAQAPGTSGRRDCSSTAHEGETASIR